MPRAIHTLFAICLLTLSLCSKEIKSLADLQGSCIAVIGCPQADSLKQLFDLGKKGNTSIHVIALDQSKASKFNQKVSEMNLQGIISTELIPVSPLPYRDFLLNAIIISDLAQAKSQGLKLEEARRCIAPMGKLITCAKGKITKLEDIPLPKGMDTWTHRYRGANGYPLSNDQYFDLPVGFKWNAGLANNFNNPEQGSNRYSATRGMVVTDGRIFTLSTVVDENLGDCFWSQYGRDQHLTCRDAFNGRFLWRKNLGDMYYGGLLVENTAPMASSAKHVFVPYKKNTMLQVSTQTGETVYEFPTQHIPGLIAVEDSVVVTATWKEGYRMGARKNWDRRRMDWNVSNGTIEAYDENSGKLLWKKEALGTSLLIDDSRVFIVTRSGKDGLEYIYNKSMTYYDESHEKALKQKEDFAKKNPNAPAKKVFSEKDKLLRNLEREDTALGQTEPPKEYTRPENWLMAFDLKTGKQLWERKVKDINRLNNNTLNLESVTQGILSVATKDRNLVEYFEAESGKHITNSSKDRERLEHFFRFRQHVCTPSHHVRDIILSNRGGIIRKGNEVHKFLGARGACLFGTVPAYGAGYIAQNWCNCTPGQIPGMIALGPIGHIPSEEKMCAPNRPTIYSSFTLKNPSDGVSRWESFRANAQRNCGVTGTISLDPSIAWTQKVSEDSPVGTVTKDWRSFLNSRLTGAVFTENRVIIANIDHQEVIATDTTNGSTAWRYSTGGRMDSSPTLYRGLCLIGDRSGYIHALDAQNGKLIYKLRIAPEEKRMVSYAKLESPWPIIGGVLIHKDKAYVSAGRTEGAAGGLIIRCFKPENGKQLWAQVSNKKNDTRRNDTLIVEEGVLRLMNN
ncbi:MAG: PQQ-binding-like beta-propeller repeat protein, partial [Planctomycetes bacterium]|nr:PQQ-binding-like beta-propeller repeat protein [Planctomycetota bacterium]